MPHGNHIYAKASDIANGTMCTYPQSGHALPHCKCVLQCFADLLQYKDLVTQKTGHGL